MNIPVEINLEPGTESSLHGTEASAHPPFVPRFAKNTLFRAPETQKAPFRGPVRREQAGFLNLQQALNSKAGVLALQCQCTLLGTLSPARAPSD